ncbi:unnamed protein product [Brassicogethes aeneus]|uniref:FOXO protein transactivation domain-containing protein n=1 Tax=Brassicogethes aeneus TaxID=1431903 RepID=A0A9P0FFX4_BRAAE|nr:unnamed protein product [Brassicogethes aeneus]
MAGNYSPDQLAGNLQQGMKLEPDSYLGYMNGQTTTQPPPPPYSNPYEFGDLNTPFDVCSAHGIRSCTCIQDIKVENCLPNIKTERMSPSGMSPSYTNSEPSPDTLNGQYMHSKNVLTRRSSNSPPMNQQHNQGTPSTMMGQLMGALNSSTILDDLNINVESFQGGFDCNVEELIKHELNMEGNLDFNFSNQQQNITQQTENAAAPQNAPPPYSAAVTSPSWLRCSVRSVYGTIFPLEELFLPGDPSYPGWRLLEQLEMWAAGDQEQHGPLEHPQTSRQSKSWFCDLLGALLQNMPLPFFMKTFTFTPTKW